MRIIGADLLDIAPGEQHHFAAAEFLVAHFRGHRRAHGASAQHPRDDRAAVREVGPDSRRALAAELRAQLSGDAARERRSGHVRLEQAAQAERLAKLEHREAPIEDDLEELAQAAAEHPVFRQQQPQPRALLLWRAPPVDGHRHQPYVETRIAAQHIDQARERRRRAALDTCIEDAARLQQRHVGACTARVPRTDDAPVWPRQSARCADVLQRRQVDTAAPLQDVAHRRTRHGADLSRRFFRAHLRTHPQRQHAPQQCVHSVRDGRSIEIRKYSSRYLMRPTEACRPWSSFRMCSGAAYSLAKRSVCSRGMI